MRWERLFEDLEGQLAAEWESERAALDSEGERLRLSRVRLQDRVRMAADSPVGVVVALRLQDGSALRGEFEAVGADFVAFRIDAPSGALALVRTDAIATVTVSEGDLVRSARPDARPRRTLEERLTLGFVLRDLARRRCVVSIHPLDGSAEAGTIDRVGVDHLDLAVHEATTVRRSGDVRAFRIVAFAWIAWIFIEGGDTPALL